MADYKGIQGFSVQKLGSDPTPADTLGQLFFNSADSEFHISALGGGSWSSGALLNQSRRNFMGGMGTTTAGGVSAGYTPSATSDLTEEYDGTCWSEENDLPQSSQWAWTSGTITAGITATGGGPPTTLNTTDEYDGTSWAAGGNYPAAFYYCNGCGTQTAAMANGGFQSGVGYVNDTNEYDGSTWTAGGNLPATIGLGGMSGTQTAAIRMGGLSPVVGPSTTNCDTYDGSSWSETASLNNPRQPCGAAPNGTTAATLCVGGAVNEGPGTVGRCEQFDGTSWAAITQLTQGRSKVASVGTNEAYLATGGDPQTGGETELWDNSPIATQTITVS